MHVKFYHVLMFCSSAVLLKMSHVPLLCIAVRSSETGKLEIPSVTLLLSLKR